MSRVLSMFRGRTPRPRRFRRGTYLLPSLFTVANMFCGWACIVFAMRGEYVTAAPFIGFAIVLDGLDGRVARATGATSEFGGRIRFAGRCHLVRRGAGDTGVRLGPGASRPSGLGRGLPLAGRGRRAPRTLQHPGQGGRQAGTSSACRAPPRPGCPRRPCSPFHWGFAEPGAALAGLPIVLVPAALMVSRLRFRSFGALIPGRRRSYLTPLAIAAVIAAIAAQPQAVLVVMAYTYLASGGRRRGDEPRPAPSVTPDQAGRFRRVGG